MGFYNNQKIMKFIDKIGVIKYLVLLFSFCFLNCAAGLSNPEPDPIPNNEKEIKPNAMTLGVKLTAQTPNPEKYFDDLIHPCVRYIAEGFAGHKWWMSASPYRGFDSSIENPILFYGDSRNDDLPPLTWTSAGVIEDTPGLGYNSDPDIFFDGTGLWVFWRENWTLDCISNGVSRGVFGKYTTDGITFSKKKYFAGEPRGDEDSEMCPIVVNFDGRIKLYGVHHQFTPNRSPLGISIWDIADNDLINNTFTKEKDVLPTYKKGFDFWHFDVFKYEDKYYSVVTPESGTEILLGKSDDGENFKFWKTPLLSNNVTGRRYFYKPSAMIHNGIFYLWNPIAEVKGSPITSRVWMSEIEFDELIQIMERQEVTTGLNSTRSVTSGHASIYSSLDGITVITDKSTVISVYSINGELVHRSYIEVGTHRIKLNKGSYIVTTDSEKFKIQVH